MKSSTEFRIGNIVKPIHPRYNEKYIEIESITFTAINVEFREYSLDEIEAIPLSEEWLKKAEFVECTDNGELKGNDRFYTHSELIGSIGLSPKFNYNLTNTRLEYVHQLQNLYFAINRTELTFNN